MKYTYITICIVILLLAGCTPEEIPEEPQQPIQPEEQPGPEPEEIPEEEQIEEPEEIHYDDEEDIGTELEEGGAEEITPQVEQPPLGEEEQIQKILSLSETKIKSYSYRYKAPSGKQYDIYVKGNKIKIDYISDDYSNYIDTEKQTAEKYCILHSRCGREWGKIADLDYYDAYTETPIDWLDEITESKKIDEGFYYGKQAWKLDTNIGEVTIDEKFGFIYSIKQEDKEYLFTDASFNAVKDSDVNVPEYLLEE